MAPPMALNARLVEIVATFNLTRAIDIINGLTKFLKLCDCGSVNKICSNIQHECGIEIFVTSSPHCVELFRIWCGIDLLLGSELTEIGVLTSSPESIQFNSLNSDHVDNSQPSVTSKIDNKQRIHLLSLLMNSFSLVLEHKSLDTTYPITLHSRQTIADRFLKSCLRPLYRLLSINDSLFDLPRSICRLLVALCNISLGTTRQLLSLFNFGYPGFQRLSLSYGFSISDIKRSIKLGHNILGLGLLGQSISEQQERQRLCRKEFIHFYCKLLETKDQSITLRALELRQFTSKITRYITSDHPNECLKIIQLLQDRIIYNTLLTQHIKRRLFRVALLDDLFLLFSVYETIYEGQTEDITQQNQFLSDPLFNTILSVLNTIEELLIQIISLDQYDRPDTNNSFLRQFFTESQGWIHSLHLPRQQRVLQKLFKMNPSFYLTTMTNIHSVMNPSIIHPRLSVVWIRHASFIATCLGLSQSELHQPIDALSLSETVHKQQQEYEQPINLEEVHLSHTRSMYEIFLRQKCQIQHTRHDQLYSMKKLTVADIYQPANYTSQYWLNQEAECQIDSWMRTRLVTSFLAGKTKLLTRSVLTSCILHSSNIIVFIGLTLIYRVCRRFKLLKHRLGSMSLSHSILNGIKRDIMCQLPEIASFIHVLQRWSSNSMDTLILDMNKHTMITFELSQKDLSLHSSDPLHSIHQTTNCYIHHKKEEEEEDDCLDDIELPGLLDDDMSQYIVPQELHSLETYIQPLNTKKRPFIDLLNEYMASKNQFNNTIDVSDLLPSCVISTCCIAIQEMFLAFDLDTTLTKYDWAKLLSFSKTSLMQQFVPKEVVEKSITQQPLTQLYQSLYILRLLDIAWNLNCCPTQSECQIYKNDLNDATNSFRMIQRSQLSTSPLQTKLIKSYLLWFEHIYDIWGYLLGRNPNSPSLSLEATLLEQLTLFCQLSIHRFLQRTQFFINSTADESYCWVKNLERYNPEADYSFNYLFISVLKTIFYHSSSFLDAINVMYQKLDNNITTGFSKQLPISFFSSVFLLMWLKRPPDGLTLRHLHLDIPKLFYWKANATENAPLLKCSAAISSCQLMCTTLRSICQLNSIAGAQFISHLCTSLGKWRDIFTPKTYTQDSTKDILKTIKKTRKEINASRKELYAWAICLHSEKKALPTETHTTISSISSTSHRKRLYQEETIAHVNKRCRLLKTDANKNSECEIGRDLIPSEKFHVPDNLTFRFPMTQKQVNNNTPVINAWTKLYSTMCGIVHSSDSIDSINPPSIIKRVYVLFEQCFEQSHNLVPCLFSRACSSLLNQIVTMSTSEEMLVEWSEEEKQSMSFIFLKILSLCEILSETSSLSITGITNDNGKIDTLDSIIDIWLAIIDTYEIWVEWGKLFSTQEKKKYWNKSKQKKIKTKKEQILHYITCPLIKQQFPLHFDISVILSKECVSLSQRAILRHAVCLSYLQVNKYHKKYTEDDLAETIPTDLNENIPTDWITGFLSIYTGSLSETDQLIRLIVQNPQNLTQYPLHSWIGYIHDFREIHCQQRTKINNNIFKNAPQIEQQDSVYQSMHSHLDWTIHPIDWLNLNKQRLDITRLVFPFQRLFSPSSDYITMSSLLQSINKELSLPNRIPSIQLQEVSQFKGITGESKLILQELIYDPATVLPFLTSRLRTAWLIIDEYRRKLQGRPAGPIRRFIDITDIADDNNKKRQDDKRTHVTQVNTPESELTEEEIAYKRICTLFSHMIDVEGVWLRRVASGGALELLILGLGCTDTYIRQAANEGLAIYRSLLIAAEDDAQCRAARLQRQRVWRAATRELKLERAKTKQLGKRQLKLEVFTEDEIREVYERLIDNEPLPVRHSFKELRELLTLIELLKNSIEVNEIDATTILPRVTVSFAASCIPILLDCSHALYRIINQFLVGKPFLNLKECPMFLTSYWSSRTTCDTERFFIFQVLARSLGIGENRCIYDNDTITDFKSNHITTWDMLNRHGILSLLLNTGCIIGIEQNNKFWGEIIIIILGLTRTNEWITIWLITHFGLLDWIQCQYIFIKEQLIQLKKEMNSSIHDIKQSIFNYCARLEALIVLLIQLARHSRLSSHRSLYQIKARCNKTDEKKHQCAEENKNNSLNMEGNQELLPFEKEIQELLNWQHHSYGYSIDLLLCLYLRLFYWAIRLDSHPLEQKDDKPIDSVISDSAQYHTSPEILYHQNISPICCNWKATWNHVWSEVKDIYPGSFLT